MGQLSALPGGDWIEEGIADLARGVESVSAMLVSIGAPRLRHLGLAIPETLSSPERRLYDELWKVDPDAAHSRYNALVRRLVRFEHAAECGGLRAETIPPNTPRPASARRRSPAPSRW